jgi:hypothetical protein
MRNTLPLSYRRFTINLLLILSFVVAIPVNGMNQTRQNDQDVSLAPAEASETYQLYLPVSMNAHYMDYHLWRSPFSISIAALHQLFENTGTNPSLVEYLQMSGATGTRVELKWSEIQPVAPQTGVPVAYNWSWYDRALGMIGRAGIQMLVTIELANAWAVDDEEIPCGPVKPERMGDLVNFLQALVARYKEAPYYVRFWEIDNEPDSTAPWGAEIGQGCWGDNGNRYADMLSQVYAAIKAVDPLATVVMGGLAYDWFTEYDDGPFVRYFPDDVMSAGGGEHMDIQNIHYFVDFREEWERWDPSSEDRLQNWLPAPTCGDVYNGGGLEYYAGGIDVIAKANHYKNRMQVCHGVDKPLWITEIAASSGRPGEETIGNHDLDWQARYVPQVYARALSVGVGNITWYGLTTPNQEDEQGLLFADFSPKPSFTAYQTMTTQLSGFRYSHTLSAPGIEGYAFRDAAGRVKPLLWILETNTSGSAEYNLAPATQVLVVDYLGNESVIVDGGAGDMDGAGNGAIKLLITENPVYVTVIAP